MTISHKTKVSETWNPGTLLTHTYSTFEIVQGRVKDNLGSYSVCLPQFACNTKVADLLGKQIQSRFGVIKSGL